MIKTLSLFSGIGGFEKALKNIGVEYDLVGYSEIDKYASKSYSVIHEVPETKNLGDITKINEKELPKDIDLITYGFPCQDISSAGYGKGLFNEDGTKTRSGLFFDALRIIEETKPKYAIAENVKALTSKRFKNEFEIVLKSLDEVGYNNYYQVLDAKGYGIPQHRERIFIVSIRKDIDNRHFKFPEPFELKLRLKDMLEDEVDEKYYLSEKQVNSIRTSTYTQNARRIQEKDFCDTLCARDWKDPKCVKVEPRRIGGLFDTEKSKHQVGSVWDKEYIAPTIDTMQGGYRQPLITEDKNVGFVEKHYRNFINKNGCLPELYNEKEIKNIAPTLTTHCNSTTSTSTILKSDGIRIRKITPKECWRLMGFTDEDFEKAQNFNSNTQLYKQAGNSVCVNVIEELYKNLLN